MIFNGIIFITVVRILLKKRKAVQRKAGSKAKGVLKTLISIFAIMMLFGLTWIFGAFTISSASTVFQFLFAITNSFEGFFIFLFLCALREDVRELWKELICCRNKKRRMSMPTGTNYKHRSRQSSSLINSSASTSRFQKTGSVYSTNSDVGENSYAIEPHYDSPNVRFELPAIREEPTLAESDSNMTAGQPKVYQTGTVDEYMLEPCYATIELASNVEESESEDEPICDSEVAPHIAIRHKLSAAMKEIAEKKTKEDEIGLLDHEVAPHIQARMRQIFRNPRLDVDDESMVTCIVNPNAILY